MSRNHIHLAQGVAGSGVISGALAFVIHSAGSSKCWLIILLPGMRNSSQILIFIDVQKAIDAGIKFYLSANGVVLTEGDEKGFLRPEFFSRVETTDRVPLAGWDGPEGVAAASAKTADKVTGESNTRHMEELEKKVEATTL